MRFCYCLFILGATIINLPSNKGLTCAFLYAKEESGFAVYLVSHIFKEIRALRDYIYLTSLYFLAFFLKNNN